MHHVTARSNATRYNKRYHRRGHVFDSPFSRVEIETEAHLTHLARYIALNPKNPETWSFSSYPGLIGLRDPFSFVDPSPILEAFGSAAAFRAYVDEGRTAEDTNLVPASPATRFEPRLHSVRFMTSPPSDSPAGSKPLRS